MHSSTGPSLQAHTGKSSSMVHRSWKETPEKEGEGKEGPMSAQVGGLAARPPVQGSWRREHAGEKSAPKRCEEERRCVFRLSFSEA